jgi:hypothetical protein
MQSTHSASSATAASLTAAGYAPCKLSAGERELLRLRELRAARKAVSR